MKNGLRIIVLMLALSAPARAENLFGEFKRVPDAIERGLYLGSDFGLLFYTGSDYITNPGFQLSFTLGYDIMKYVSIEGLAIMGISEAHPQIYSGGINSFLFDGAIKGAYPLGRFYPFVELGGGIHYSSPEIVLSTAPITGAGSQHMNILLGFGMEYYTYLRHYSLYLKGTYVYIDLPIDQISTSIGLKYTF